MKFNIKNKLTAGVALLSIMLSANSCKKGVFYEGLNTNPAQLTTPTPTLLLPGVITSTGYVWDGDASRFSSLFIQQATGSANQANSFSAYAVGTGDVDGLWTNLYGGAGGVMTNANQLIQLANKAGDVHYAGIGEILMANALGLTTDFWGDVPYSQAFQGAANVNPSYDSQQQIYTTIDGLLTDAITKLAASDAGAQPGTDDLIYGGNLKNWSALAYGLKAKFYIHLGKTDPSNYAKAIAAAKSAIAGGFNSAATNFAVPFLGASTTSQSPWYQFNSQRGDIAFTGYIYDIMKAAKDPREVSTVYGDGQGSLGDLYGSPSSPVELFTYDELLFVESEAYYQTNDKVNAAATYNAAVAANLTRTVGSAGYAATVAKTAANITLNDVMTQKYIADFLDPETWTDYRRTGLPALTPNPQGNGVIPRSLLYPISEVINNSSTPKNTTLARKVYWDK